VVKGKGCVYGLDCGYVLLEVSTVRSIYNFGGCVFQGLFKVSISNHAIFMLFSDGNCSKTHAFFKVIDLCDEAANSVLIILFGCLKKFL